MQLIVDIGNTRVKSGLFKGSELISHSISEESVSFVIEDHFNTNPNIEALIISSVGESVEAEDLSIPDSIQHVIFDHKTPLPINNLYESPETLGLDRIALAVGASSRFPNKNCLIVDAGTCLTMDIITDQVDYLGGVISPGIQLRLNSMHNGTANLPDLQHDFSIPKKIGKNTVECMRSGAVNGMLNEISGTINAMKDSFDNLKILLTGGDAELFDNELKSGIFADRNLVLRGLNKILLHNIEKH